MGTSRSSHRGQSEGPGRSEKGLDGNTHPENCSVHMMRRRLEGKGLGLPIIFEDTRGLATQISGCAPLGGRTSYVSCAFILSSGEDPLGPG